MDFWTTAVAAAVGVFASTLVKTWFDHYISGASIKSAQQDDDLQAIIESTFDVKNRAVDYWKSCAKGEQDACDAAAIAARLMFIGKVADEMFESDPNLKKAVQLELNRFDDSITNGSFMVKKREADLTRLSEIEDSAYSLVYRVRRCRRNLKRYLFKA